MQWFTLYFKVLFIWTHSNNQWPTCSTSKRMMERSSRFISLSGLSGIAAGICALVGAWFANNVIADKRRPVGIQGSCKPYLPGRIAAGFYGASAISNCRVYFLCSTNVLHFYLLTCGVKKIKYPCGALLHSG